jgi:hypothetical protein
MTQKHLRDGRAMLRLLFSAVLIWDYLPLVQRCVAASRVRSVGSDQHVGA